MTALHHWSGQHVWITGAGKGIGRALSLALAADGARVAASARTAADLESLVVAAEDLPGSITAHPLDVTDGVATVALIQALEAEAPLDAAILNAGTYKPMGVRNFKAATLAYQMDVNIMGVAHGLEALLPAMTKRGRGRIGVVSSVTGIVGLPESSVYGLTKAGLINMVEALAPEASLRGVSLSVICPGFVRTPLTDRNTFAMPFLMEPEQAAAIILRGMAKGKLRISFPWQMVWALRLLHALPDRLMVALTRRMVPQDKIKNDRSA